MGKKNKILVLFTFIIIIITISVLSIIKVYKNHINNMYLVIENKIVENAKKCFQDNLCIGDETTLEILIANGYLDNQVHPITKEYIDKNLKITYDGKKCYTSIR